MAPIFETQYLPSVAWCAAAWPFPEIALESQESYVKGSFRNRCHIAGPNGLQRLSIPLLKGKHQQLPIREVRISYLEEWQRQHWRSIKTAYGSAPYFEHYAAELEAFYSQKTLLLFDWNLSLIRWCMAKLGWKGSILMTKNYLHPNASAGQHDFRGVVAPGASPPDWFFPARYGQVFQERHGFLENLSVLDLIFCCGKLGVAQLQKGYMPS